MMSDSLFSDAGWLFFVIWSIAVGVVNITAFDLVPTKAAAPSRNTSAPQTHDDDRSAEL